VSSSTLEPNKKKSLSRRAVVKCILGAGAGAVGLSLGLTWRRRARTKWPNIILITLDTTRRDRLGCYGYRRPTSPNLDRLADDSLVYDQAIAPANWTLPAHASLFTGKFSTSHGAKFDPEGPLSLAGQLTGASSFYRKFRVRGLDANEVTLATSLKQAGYATGAVVAGPWLKRPFGLHKGFDHYDDQHINVLNGRLASQVTPAALGLLDKLSPGRFFLFLNYFDPHEPYFPPEGFAHKFLPQETALKGLQTGQFTSQEKNALYDAEILYMDHHIGQLLAELRRRKLYDKTWIIVAADHGEMLGEHDRFGHGHRLYQEEIHIPLFMKYPHGEVSPGRTDDRVQLTDLLPMILHRLDLARPQDIQGGLPPYLAHPIISETYPLEVMSPDGDSRALFKGHLKYVWNSKGNHGLHNLGNDPHEQVNLMDKQPQQAQAMLAELDNYLAALPRPGPAGPQGQIDEKTRRALQSLGYLGD